MSCSAAISTNGMVYSFAAAAASLRMFRLAIVAVDARVQPTIGDQPSLCALGEAVSQHQDSMQRALGDLTYGRYGLNVTVVGWYHDTSLGEISDTTMIQNSDRYFTLPQSAGDLDLSEFDLLMLYGLADSGSSEAAQGQSQLVRDLACEAACEERGEDSCLTTCQIGGRSDFGTIFAINTGGPGTPSA
eukprot:4211686-Pleurochrysis_carterae.AAC.1